MNYDAIVLLACGMNEADTRIGWKMDLDAHIRTAATARLFREGVAPKIAVAGGYMNHPKSLSSAIVHSLSTKYQIPREDILNEERSDDTTENAEFIREVLDENGISRDNLALVTSGYHLPRARKIFIRYGMNPDGCIAEGVLSRVDPRLEKLVSTYQCMPEYDDKRALEDKMLKVLGLPLGHRILRGLAHLKLRKFS